MFPKVCSFFAHTLAVPSLLGVITQKKKERKYKFAKYISQSAQRTPLTLSALGISVDTKETELQALFLCCWHHVSRRIRVVLKASQSGSRAIFTLCSISLLLSIIAKAEST